MKLRKTDYPIGSKVVIQDEIFHDFKKGEEVIIINKDMHSYHVRSIDDKKFWWVRESQIKKQE